MPLEIKELNITAVIDNEKKTTNSNIDLNALRKKILKECVEEVLNVLAEKNER